MRIRNRITFFGVVFISLMSFVLQGQKPPAHSVNIDSILHRIAEINEIHTESTTIDNTFSEQYQNYLTVKKHTNTQQLAALTNTTNPIVVCYAAWALIDENYKNMADVFAKIQTQDSIIQVFNGSFRKKERISENIYYRYWNQVPYGERVFNKSLYLIDSLVLYHNSSSWVLVTRALKNRLYPASFNPQIEHWAFEKDDRDAIFYLANWYRAEYESKIQLSLLLFLNKTDFKVNGTKIYYSTVEELLRCNDEDIRAAVIIKLKKDRSWLTDKEIFKPMIERFGIYMGEFE